jgi:hypothetical protein
MHVLPLPFGLALAVLPRREIDRIRRRDMLRVHLRNAIRPRERVLDDISYFRYL